MTSAAETEGKPAGLGKSSGRVLGCENNSPPEWLEFHHHHGSGPPTRSRHSAIKQILSSSAPSLLLWPLIRSHVDPVERNPFVFQQSGRSGRTKGAAGRPPDELLSSCCLWNLELWRISRRNFVAGDSFWRPNETPQSGHGKSWTLPFSISPSTSSHCSGRRISLLAAH